MHNIMGLLAEEVFILRDLAMEERYSFVPDSNLIELLTLIRLQHFSIDGKKLWSHIKEHKPIILSGVPRGGWAESQKRRWCCRELGDDVVVKLCESRNKNRYCKSGDILIDDRKAAKVPWEYSGGTFIHHKSANRTILILDNILEKRRCQNSTRSPVGSEECSGMSKSNCVPVVIGGLVTTIALMRTSILSGGSCSFPVTRPSLSSSCSCSCSCSSTSISTYSYSYSTSSAALSMSSLNSKYSSNSDSNEVNHKTHKFILLQNTESNKKVQVDDCCGTSQSYNIRTSSRGEEDEVLNANFMFCRSDKKESEEPSLFQIEKYCFHRITFSPSKCNIRDEESSSIPSQRTFFTAKNSEYSFLPNSSGLQNNENNTEEKEKEKRMYLVFEEYQETVNCILALLSYHVISDKTSIFGGNHEFHRLFAVNDDVKIFMTVRFCLFFLKWEEILKRDCSDALYDQRYGNRDDDDDNNNNCNINNNNNDSKNNSYNNNNNNNDNNDSNNNNNNNNNNNDRSRLLRRT